MATGMDDMLAGQVEAVILAGGHVWGEDPLEQAVCRPLVSVAGRPLLLHTVEWLRRGGIARVNICVNHEGGQIRKLLGDGSDLGIEVNYFEDVMPRGPAGCARDVAMSGDARRFLVMEGTILPQIELGELLARESPAMLTVVVTPSRRDSEPRERVLEPAGIYLFSRAAFDHVPATGFQDIKETLIPRLHVNGERIDTLVLDGQQVWSVNGLAAYLRVSHLAVEQLMQREAPDGYLRADGALVHQSARVHASARLVGPVLVGPAVDLGPGCVVVGPATIGSGTQVGAGAAVCRCVVWSECVIEERAVLDQCIVTDDSVVRAERDLRHAVVVPSRRSRLQRERTRGAGGARQSWGPMAMAVSNGNGAVLAGVGVTPGEASAGENE